jgi:hypothetical protein
MNTTVKPKEAIEKTREISEQKAQLRVEQTLAAARENRAVSELRMAKAVGHASTIAAYAMRQAWEACANRSNIRTNRELLQAQRGFYNYLLDVGRGSPDATHAEQLEAQTKECKDIGVELDAIEDVLGGGDISKILDLQLCLLEAQGELIEFFVTVLLADVYRAFEVEEMVAA